jgi:hypothetical protein
MQEISHIQKIFIVFPRIIRMRPGFGGTEIKQKVNVWR